MVVPNLVFDAILFGALLLAALLDNTFPSLQGTAFLLVVGTATYVAAQEMCDTLHRRSWWTQESLATALSLSTGGFIYVWWRNDSDLAWLVLSIGLMMASLMVAIAMIAALGTSLRERSGKPLSGLLMTIVGAFTLGILAGLLTLQAPVYIKAIVVGVGVILWKLRETMRPPEENVLSREALTVGLPARPTTPAAPAEGQLTARAAAALGEAALDTAATAPRMMSTHPSGRWILIPQRGTLLDRFLPMLILGALLFFFAKQVGLGTLWPSAPVASASSSNSTNAASNSAPQP
ncbi:MAG: hypothetical protein M3347_09100 [Armatimonadota bacterium]|nr:hypothetical protein [Armatimonadota bacterium]